MVDGKLVEILSVLHETVDKFVTPDVDEDEDNDEDAKVANILTSVADFQAGMKWIQDEGLGNATQTDIDKVGNRNQIEEWNTKVCNLRGEFKRMSKVPALFLCEHVAVAVKHPLVTSDFMEFATLFNKYRTEHEWETGIFSYVNRSVRNLESTPHFMTFRANALTAAKRFLRNIFVTLKAKECYRLVLQFGSSGSTAAQISNHSSD